MSAHHSPSVWRFFFSLYWRHDERDGVSNHQRLNCLLNRLFRRRSKKASKLCVAGLCEGNSPVTGEFPAQRASNKENASIWWRHNVSQFLHDEPMRKGLLRGFIVFLIQRPFAANITLNQVCNQLSETTLRCLKAFFTKPRQFSELAKDPARQYLCFHDWCVLCNLCNTLLLPFPYQRKPKCFHCAYRYNWTNGAMPSIGGSWLQSYASVLRNSLAIGDSELPILPDNVI